MQRNSGESRTSIVKNSRERIEHMNIRFKDREDAGLQLASALDRYAQHPDVVVLGLPRGGIPVAYEVARELDAPLDVFVVRKLGLPAQPELAMGAVASGGLRVLNREVVESLHVSDAVLDEVQAREEKELQRREEIYREGRQAVTLAGKTVIVVDDGLATGATMRVAIKALHEKKPLRIIAAAPVSSPAALRMLEHEADETEAVITPQPMFAIGEWYMNFSQTSDEEVRDYLRKSNDSTAAGI